MLRAERACLSMQAEERHARLCRLCVLCFLVLLCVVPGKALADEDKALLFGGFINAASPGAVYVNSDGAVVDNSDANDVRNSLVVYAYFSDYDRAPSGSPKVHAGSVVNVHTKTTVTFHDGNSWGYEDKSFDVSDGVANYTLTQQELDDYATVEFSAASVDDLVQDVCSEHMWDIVKYTNGHGDATVTVEVTGVDVDGQALDLSYAGTLSSSFYVMFENVSYASLDSSISVPNTLGDATPPSARNVSCEVCDADGNLLYTTTLEAVWDGIGLPADADGNVQQGLVLRVSGVPEGWALCDKDGNTFPSSQAASHAYTVSLSQAADSSTRTTLAVYAIPTERGKANLSVALPMPMSQNISTEGDVNGALKIPITVSVFDSNGDELEREAAELGEDETASIDILADDNGNPVVPPSWRLQLKAPNGVPRGWKIVGDADGVLDDDGIELSWTDQDKNQSHEVNVEPAVVYGTLPSSMLNENSDCGPVFDVLDCYGKQAGAHRTYKLVYTPDSDATTAFGVSGTKTSYFYIHDTGGPTSGDEYHPYASLCNLDLTQPGASTSAMVPAYLKAMGGDAPYMAFGFLPGHYELVQTGIGDDGVMDAATHSFDVKLSSDGRTASFTDLDNVSVDDGVPTIFSQEVCYLPVKPPTTDTVPHTDNGKTPGVGSPTGPTADSGSTPADDRAAYDAGSTNAENEYETAQTADHAGVLAVAVTLLGVASAALLVLSRAPRRRRM